MFSKVRILNHLSLPSTLTAFSVDTSQTNETRLWERIHARRARFLQRDHTRKYSSFHAVSNFHSCNKITFKVSNRSVLEAIPHLNLRVGRQNDLYRNNLLEFVYNFDDSSLATWSTPYVPSGSISMSKKPFVVHASTSLAILLCTISPQLIVSVSQDTLLRTKISSAVK